ncbi:MAG TPA: adenosylcobinamide-GDP ribazoletransferase [Solirubrobacterales bacterium]
MGASLASVRWAFGGLLDALGFLTILPLPRSVTRRESFDLAAAVTWFPMVGALIGGFAGGLRVAFEPLLGHAPSTVIAMIGLVVITGALHQDALADTVDGLGVHGSVERRLEVMRDPRVGAFGALALIAWALLLFTALNQLGPEHALLALIAAAVAGRLAGPLHGLIARSARREGLGARLHVGVRAALAATLVATVILVALLGAYRGGVTSGIAVLIGASTALLARRMLAGSTGDTIGTAIALTEICVCLALVALWR